MLKSQAIEHEPVIQILSFAEAEGGKKEFQKKSANLLRCRAHWNPRVWNQFNYAFIDPAQKRFQLFNQVQLILPPSYSATKPRAPHCR